MRTVSCHTYIVFTAVAGSLCMLFKSLIPPDLEGAPPGGRVNNARKVQTVIAKLGAFFIVIHFIFSFYKIGKTF